MTAPVPVNRPVVAAQDRTVPKSWIVCAFLLLGLAVFIFLSEARASAEENAGFLPALAPNATAVTPTPLPTAPVAAADPSSTTPYFMPNSDAGAAPSDARASVPFAALTSAVPFSSAEERARERLRAPVLIVDLAQVDIRRPGAPGTVQRDSGERSQGLPLPGAPSAADRTLSDVERFSDRVGNEEVATVKAERLTGLDLLVSQGTIIGAVMETALNSDLPGYARAVTQRDVYSFDGSTILIPAGSRVIGQYKSGIAQGASRVFVLWTRLVRADGVSINLASPAVDELGRGGVAGKVSSHFFQRFAGAILTTVLTGGIDALAASAGGRSTVFVGTAGQASTLAGQAGQSAEIPPTITTKQGAAVRIFVARDLDFSAVGPPR